MRHATRQRHLKHLHKTAHHRRACYFHSCNPTEQSQVNQAPPYVNQQHLHEQNKVSNFSI